MKIIKTKPIQFFVPITRLDEAERIVEGYAFVNEVVNGEGGIRLKRSAMEAATADYMDWGALRVMHQPLAAGTTQNVEWDERGAFIRAKVVDDNEWKKVVERVYKGFSVGVSPQVMRGLDVEKCLWAETSLVDRPKDWDAQIVCFRAEGAADGEVEAQQLEDQPVEVVIVDAAAPASFAERMNREELWDCGYEAMDTLFSTLLEVAYCESADKAGLAQQSIQEFSDYIVPLVAGGTLPKEKRAAASDAAPQAGEVQAGAEGGEVNRADTPAAPAAEGAPAPAAAPPAPADAPAAGLHRAELAESITRLGRVESRQEAAITRLDTVEGAVGSLGDQLTALLARVQQVERAPVAINAPVRFPAQMGAADREFASNGGGGAVDPRAGLNAELKRLQDELPQEPDEKKRTQGVVRMQEIKMALSSLG